MEQEVVRKILRRRRVQLDPETVGLPPRDRAGRRGPKVSGLIQEDVDLLMGRAYGTYGRVEVGRIRPTAEYLRDVARLLRLSEDEYTFVHLELFGTEPVLALHPDDTLTVEPAWQRAVDQQREMAYVNDRRYNLVLHNEAFAAMFPSGKLPANTMEWMLLADEARDYCLVDWDTEWGPRVVPQFRAALAAHPDDPVLTGIHQRALADERVRPILQHPEKVYIHPDGDRRPLRHAVRGLGWATMIVAQPLTLPGGRYMTVLFDEAPSQA